MQPRSFALLFSALTMALAASAATLAGAGAPDATPTAAVKRGEYLVRFGSCHDCHTPLKLGANGPEPDFARALSGHPSDFVLPPAPEPTGPWIWGGAGTNTAFWGPWGVSFTANLTPDAETGLGNWTEEQFMTALRTGRHEGKGRPILPPMPYQFVGSLTDEDLKAVFAYLKSLPPVQNRVPSPIDPPEGESR